MSVWPAAVGRVVFEAAVLGRVVRGGDDNAIGQPGRAPAVVAQDRVRDDGGRRIPAAGLDDRVDPVRGKHFQRCALGGLGQGMGVLAQIKRAGDPGRGAVLAQGLGDGQDVLFVEGVLARRAAMARGAKGYSLFDDVDVGRASVIGADQLGDVNEHFARRGFARQGVR
jgi:hypothetical protein